MQPWLGWAEVGHLTLPLERGMARVMIGVAMARIMQRQIVGQRKTRKSVTICYRPRGRKRKRIGSRIAQLCA